MNARPASTTAVLICRNYATARCATLETVEGVTGVTHVYSPRSRARVATTHPIARRRIRLLTRLAPALRHATSNSLRISGEWLRALTGAASRGTACTRRTASATHGVDDAPHRFEPPIVGTSPAAHRLRDLVLTLAGSDVSVLITGDSGVGKEVLARNLHRFSRRAHAAFVSVNCAALAPGILESELFGHDRGAFTGAVRSHAGLFEQANGGTLFLDEIGEIPPYIQAKLLRVLQEGEVRRMGEGSVRRVDVRIITATNANLAEMVASGAFRKDLFYRINVVEARVPSLRERRDDVLDLVAHFFERRGSLPEAVDPGSDAAAFWCRIRGPATCASWRTRWSACGAARRAAMRSRPTCSRSASRPAPWAPPRRGACLCESPLAACGRRTRGESAQAHAGADQLEQVASRAPAGALAPGADQEDQALRDREE